MSFISLMEIIGTVAFAVSGALVAIEKKLDIYGVTFLAIITAVGGGVIRDIIINLPLPVALSDPVYVVICIATAAVVICFYKWVKKVNGLVVVFDAVGLAAFTAIGAKAALNNDVYTPFVVIPGCRSPWARGSPDPQNRYSGNQAGWDTGNSRT